jgi:hypothetical protein
MDDSVKKDIWAVMEDFSKTSGDKDLGKMKERYEMFVDVTVVDSKHLSEWTTLIFSSDC